MATEEGGRPLQCIQPIVQSEENSVISQNRYTIQLARPIYSEETQSAVCDLVSRPYASEVN